MDFRSSVFLLFLSLLSFSPLAFPEKPAYLLEFSLRVSTPFSIALTNLQNQINYTFKNVELLRRAMTHASFSEENNKALSMLGTSVIETSVALQSLRKDVDISAMDLNLLIAQVSKVEGYCNADGTRLGLQKIVRVSRKTNVTASVVCGAFRGVLGRLLWMLRVRMRPAGSFWKFIVRSGLGGNLGKYCEYYVSFMFGTYLMLFAKLRNN